MGNFYVNYTLHGPSQTTVATALTGRSAIVAPAQHDSIVVFDQESDEQSQDVVTNLASQLSRQLKCSVLAVLNHDDDILCYHLDVKGDVFDEYNSSPSYFDPSAEPSAPSGGDAQKLCSAFGASNFTEVEGILRKPSFDEEGYTFEVDRHSDLVVALGISTFGVGCGYRNLVHGELPDGLSEDDLIRVK